MRCGRQALLSLFPNQVISATSVSSRLTLSDGYFCWFYGLFNSSACCHTLSYIVAFCSEMCQNVPKRAKTCQKCTKSVPPNVHIFVQIKTVIRILPETAFYSGSRRNDHFSCSESYWKKKTFILRCSPLPRRDDGRSSFTISEPDNRACYTT